jgi:hypothetical protein
MNPFVSASGEYGGCMRRVQHASVSKLQQVDAENHIRLDFVSVDMTRGNQVPIGGHLAASTDDARQASAYMR